MTKMTFDFDRLSDKGIKAALKEVHAEAADILAVERRRDLPPVDYVDGCIVVNFPDAFIAPPTDDELLALETCLDAETAEPVEKRPGRRVRVRLHEPRRFWERAAELSKG